MPGSMMSSRIAAYCCSRASHSPSVPGVRDVDREALRLEAALEPLGQARLVVHHQQSHESIVAHAR